MSATIATKTEFLKFVQNVIKTSGTYITKVQFMTIISELIDFILRGTLTIETKSVAFTITAKDKGKIFLCQGASAYDVTIDTTDMQVGDNFGIIQVGAGIKTIVSSTTINEPDGFVATESEWSAVSILIAEVSGAKVIILNGRLA